MLADTIETVSPFGALLLEPSHLKQPGTLLNRITLSNSTVTKCATGQAVKQPTRGRALNTEEQNVPPLK